MAKTGIGKRHRDGDHRSLTVREISVAMATYRDPI